MKGFLALAFAFGLAFGLELNQVNVKVEGHKLFVNGKSYSLSRDVKVENIAGEELPLESLWSTRAIRLEFDKAGNVKLI
ncbi:MAG: hypothetical protein ACK4VK_05155, partial [Aquificaceae bacterium]